MPMRYYYSKGMKRGQEGVLVVHAGASIPTIQEIITKHDPDLMIEFGTSWAGFTKVMLDSKPMAEMHTFDFGKGRSADYDKVKKYKFLWDNTKNRKWKRGEIQRNTIIFHNFDILVEESEVIKFLCKREEKKVLYCDNGDKVKEIRLYANYLNIGDLLGAHDFGKEYEMVDIEKYLNNFEPVEHKIFEENGWTTRFWRKIGDSSISKS